MLTVRRYALTEVGRDLDFVDLIWLQVFLRVIFVDTGFEGKAEQIRIDMLLLSQACLYQGRFRGSYAPYSGTSRFSMTF